MKYQLNWHLFNLSNNYLLKKKIDDCIILYDDKDYINVILKYYQDVLFITNTNTFDNNNLYDIFKKDVETQLSNIINYGEYLIVPIYSNTTLKNKNQITIINIGIFILSDFKFKKKLVYTDISNIFLLHIKYGIVENDDDIEELKTRRYPELKSNVDNILYIKQAGYYFNLFKCFNYTYKNSNKKIQLELPVNSKDELHIVDIGDIFENAHSYWDNWQIIWRSNKYAITKYFKGREWNSMNSITDNVSKKYRNIVFNQSLMSENKVINSINNINIDIINSNNIKIKNNVDINYDLSQVINKVSNLSLHKNKKTYEERLKSYSKFSGSKHLHYLKKEKIKDKAIIEMLKELNI
jgi:hypothetical protein